LRQDVAGGLANYYGDGQLGETIVSVLEKDGGDDIAARTILKKWRELAASHEAEAL